MKKLLIVAALVATAAIPATPGFAADMTTPAPMAKSSGALCFFLPLLPDCMAMWKAHMPTTKMAMPAPTMPKMMSMPNCTKAAAGAGHLLDCKMA